MLPAGKPKFDSISAAKKMENVADSMKHCYSMQMTRPVIICANICATTFIYSANRIGEICDNIMAIDNAMKWGYNQQAGSFRIMGCRRR